MTTHPSVHAAGFSILEVIIGMGILVIVSTALFLAYSNTLDIVSSGQYYSTAANIVESEIEAIRNMRYEDIGTVGGVPPGKLPAEKVRTLNETDFTVRTFVRNVDDAFDGTLGGTPNDTDPADYRLVEIHVVCDTCARYRDVRMTTIVAPRNLERTDLSGNLTVQVLDALGQVLPDATVVVENSSVTPPISLTDVTDANGLLELVGVPSSSAGYRITVTRSGYSTDRTYPPDDPANPNPTKPDVTVAAEQLTVASFAIDRTATLNISSIDPLCAPVTDIDVLVTGTKLIGTLPDVPKYSVAHTTGVSGTLSLPGLEWGSYGLAPTDVSYAVAATTQSSPVALDPAATVSLTWVVVPRNPSALLVTVVDDLGNPVDGATVRVASGSTDVRTVSGFFPWEKGDWSGGQYSGTSGIAVASSGFLTLQETGGSYATGSYAWLESTTVDFGSDASFSTLAWVPTSQPSEVGSDSVRFQIAANNDNATWNYIGPDGTAASYFTSSGATLPGSLSGNRYLRYRVEMRTLDSQFTPTIERVSLTFRSSCVPSGGAYFSGLTGGTYTISVTDTPFQDFSEPDVSVLADWQEFIAPLTP